MVACTGRMHGRCRCLCGGGMILMRTAGRRQWRWRRPRRILGAAGDDVCLCRCGLQRGRCLGAETAGGLADLPERTRRARGTPAGITGRIESTPAPIACTALRLGHFPRRPGGGFQTTANVTSSSLVVPFGANLAGHTSAGRPARCSSTSQSPASGPPEHIARSDDARAGRRACRAQSWLRCRGISRQVRRVHRGGHAARKGSLGCPCHAILVYRTCIE